MEKSVSQKCVVLGRKSNVTVLQNLLPMLQVSINENAEVKPRTLESEFC